MTEGPAAVPNGSEEPYRRRHVRVAVATAVQYSRDGDGTPAAGYSNDLSGGGLRLATEEDLPLGVVLLLRFSLTGVDREIVVRGRVVLSFYAAEEKRYFHGIAFTQIDPRDQQAIIDYVSEEVQRQAIADEPDDVEEG